LWRQSGRLSYTAEGVFNTLFTFSKSTYLEIIQVYDWKLNGKKLFEADPYGWVNKENHFA